MQSFPIETLVCAFIYFVLTLNASNGFFLLAALYLNSVHMLEPLGLSVFKSLQATDVEMKTFLSKCLHHKEKLPRVVKGHKVTSVCEGCHQRSQ